MYLIKKIRGGVRYAVINLRLVILRTLYGMDIDRSARISFGARLDKTNPRGVHIGKESYVASGAIVFAHDFSRSLHADTRIGERCFIGANAIIMCGVRIGDEVVVGSGTIVTKDVPSHSIVVGNPGRVIRENICTGRFGQIQK